MASASDSEPVVLLEGASIRYGRRWVLRGVSTQLHGGEVVGVFGPGGSGKSQLFRAISTLRHLNRGDLTLFGQHISRYNARLLAQTRRRIGLQFQNFALFDFLDVWHNVAFPLLYGLKLGAEEIRPRVDQALETVGMAHASAALPADLSGGMRRRVAIARVLASRPAIAIFDDPVAGLDPVNSAKIMALLSNYAREASSLVLIATHDLERLLPITTRVLGLFAGRLLFDGPVDRVSRCPEQDVRDFVEAATESWQTREGTA